MPPRIKVMREEIVKAGVALVRRDGAAALNARNIASELHCSTQPVFSNFSTMDALREAVIEATEALCEEYIRQEVESGKYPPYKASGMGYIRFAKEEKELFKLLYMRNRAGQAVPQETELGNRMESIVHRNTGLEGDEKKLFHLEMWIYVHGIATMLATDFLDLPWELVSKMLTDSYQGLKKQYGKE